MQKCKYCNKDCKNNNALRNHERLCKLNPNHQINKIELIRYKAFAKIECEFCQRLISKNGLKRHIKFCDKNPNNEIKFKICPQCNNRFRGDNITCSYSCSNSYFRTGKNHGNWKGNNYRKIAEHNHALICIVCGENKIVAIHHYDGNKNNNNPDNLVPLCPTHHCYIHSKYMHLIIDVVNDYVKNFKKIDAV